MAVRPFLLLASFVEENTSKGEFDMRAFCTNRYRVASPILNRFEIPYRTFKLCVAKVALRSLSEGPSFCVYTLFQNFISVLPLAIVADGIYRKEFVATFFLALRLHCFLPQYFLQEVPQETQQVFPQTLQKCILYRNQLHSKTNHIHNM